MRPQLVGAPPQKHALVALARAAERRHGLPDGLFVAQIGRKENPQWDPIAVSDKGALGIAQIMPNTAKSWGVNPWEPAQALDGAARAMAGYWRTYRNRHHLPPDEAYRWALAAYNAGPGAVAKYDGVPPYPETQDYVAAIMGRKG